MNAMTSQIILQVYLLPKAYLTVKQVKKLLSRRTVRKKRSAAALCFFPYTRLILSVHLIRLLSIIRVLSSIRVVYFTPGSHQYALISLHRTVARLVATESVLNAKDRRIAINTPPLV